MNNFRNQINDLFIYYFKNKIVPWRNSVPCPVNTVNQKYAGINIILLQLAAKKYEFTSNLWGTQGNLPGTNILLYKPTFWGNKIEVQTVFNLKSNIVYQPDYELAEQIITSSGVKIKSKEGNQALYFYPPEDYIVIPPKIAFILGKGGINGYYETIFHELMHWSELKLSWQNNSTFPLALRELRAEIGSAFICMELGIPLSSIYSSFKKYFEKWIDFMKYDKDLIFRVCMAVTKAVDYLFAFAGKFENRFNMVEEKVA